MTCSEIWKDIEGYEDYYEVSNLGRIRSKSRVAKTRNGRSHTVKSKVLSPGVWKDGYERVRFSVGGKMTGGKVHRFVANAFCPNPENKKEVNHINGVKTDNRACNLEWMTRSENQKHAFDKGLQKPQKGSSNPKSKIDEITALTIKTFIGKKYSQTKLSELMGVSKWIIQDISRGKTWNHL